MNDLTNSMVMYGTNGICKVLGKKIITIQGQEKEYLILQPIYHSDKTIYIPNDNDLLKSKMKELLSFDEVNQLIENIVNEESTWIQEENKRKAHYQEIINNGNRSQLMSMIKSLYVHEQERRKDGKQLYQVDKSLLSKAEEILFEEFAYVLSIGLDQVLPFISNQLLTKN